MASPTVRRITLDDPAIGAILQAFALGLLEGDGAEQRIDLYRDIRKALDVCKASPAEIEMEISTDSLKAWAAGILGGWTRQGARALNDAQKDLLLRSAAALKVEGITRGMLPPWKAPTGTIALDSDNPFVLDDEQHAT